MNHLIILWHFKDSNLLIFHEFSQYNNFSCNHYVNFQVKVSFLLICPTHLISHRHMLSDDNEELEEFQLRTLCPMICLLHQIESNHWAFACHYHRQRCKLRLCKRHKCVCFFLRPRTHQPPGTFSTDLCYRQS